MTDRPAILVIGPAWVGDMVMAQSLFRALKARHPECVIDVLAPPWSLALLERMPEVRTPIALDVAHGEAGLGKRWRMGRALRTADYTRAIVLPRSAKAALPAWLAGIPKRTGYLGEYRYGLLNDIRPLDRNRLYRTVDRFVALADDVQPAGVDAPPPSVLAPQLESSPAQQAAARQALGLASATGDDPDTPALALCPGAEYGPAKRWPPEYFAAVARHYLERDWRVWLFGSDKDRPITRAIAEQAPGVIELAGRTTLAQAIDLLAASQVAITNDSGLMHVATATGTPVVALYGSSDPQYTPPLGDQTRIVYRGLECSPCFARECPLGHLDCLRGIVPAQVIDAADALIADALIADTATQANQEPR